MSYQTLLDQLADHESFVNTQKTTIQNVAKMMETWAKKTKGIDLKQAGISNQKSGLVIMLRETCYYQDYYPKGRKRILLKAGQKTAYEPSGKRFKAVPYTRKKMYIWDTMEKQFSYILKLVCKKIERGTKGKAPGCGNYREI
jgi:hypothetical protein